MFRVIRSGEIARHGGTLTFQGEVYGSGVSFFLVEEQPPFGPGLHRHPYSETWIIRRGEARFTVNGENVRVGAGDILVVAPETPHKFVGTGEEVLDVICIHDSPRMIQESLEE